MIPNDPNDLQSSPIIHNDPNDPNDPQWFQFIPNKPQSSPKPQNPKTPKPQNPISGFIMIDMMVKLIWKVDRSASVVKVEGSISEIPFMNFK